MSKAGPTGVLAVVPAGARGPNTDERDVWEARVYLRLVFEDMALLFDSALVGCLPDWSRKPSAGERVGWGHGHPLGRDVDSGQLEKVRGFAGATDKRAPCAAGHDTDLWCEYCQPKGPSSEQTPTEPPPAAA